MRRPLLAALTLALTLGLTLGLSACSSIPLSSAWRLSQMSMQRFAQLEPAQLQVRVAVPVGFELQPGATRLSLALQGAQAERSAGLGLAVTSVSRGTRPGAWLQADVPVSVYALRLSPEGVQQLQALQAFIRARQPDRFEFSLETLFSTVPAGAQEVRLWADLKLSDAEPFMPLLDGARIPAPASAPATKR